ncbi:dihydrofolate reductase [Azorhizobium oxalatiphilum]|uniref:Dihydrofolate reductase n=1 Tax=Azorhizobium oxalatiphilum TaxID=980631 RepID=A0A917BL70_9HYPH|nr:NAD(P)-dependent oxidoreductase [Azorhizobium oxalatiphilum]GGF50438.1 dihydrofolate reductase [Azorhizobium oxalatiphilum]
MTRASGTKAGETSAKGRKSTPRAATDAMAEGKPAPAKPTPAKPTPAKPAPAKPAAPKTAAPKSPTRKASAKPATPADGRRRVWSHVGAAGRKLAGTPYVGSVLDLKDGASPWVVPKGVDTILTRPGVGWRDAPKSPPAGWPGRVRHFHSISTGMDVYPAWVFDCPLVTCGRGTNSGAIAEYVLAAILEAERKLAQAFARPGIRPMEAFPFGGLDGRTVGLLGFGTIGRAVAVRARAFGMNVVAFRRSAGAPEDGVRFSASAQEVVAASQHLVLALPLTPATRHMVSTDLLKAAQPGLHLINVARGELVDHDALMAWLAGDAGASATLDVTEPEPLPADHPLLYQRRVRLTPHISWQGSEADGRAVEVFLDNLAAVEEKRPPLGLVSRDAGY